MKNDTVSVTACMLTILVFEQTTRARASNSLPDLRRGSKTRARASRLLNISIVVERRELR